MSGQTGDHLENILLQLSDVGCPRPTVRKMTARCDVNNLVTMLLRAGTLHTTGPWRGRGGWRGSCCSLTPRPPPGLVLLLAYVGASTLGRHGPPPCFLKSSHHGQASTESSPCLCWPELVRPARLLPLVLFRILLEAICTPRHLAASQHPIHPLPGCNLHLFPVASGRCRGARLTRSALPRFEQDGIQTPMAKQNTSLAAVAQVIFTSPLYRTRRSFDWPR